jgi:hypothetical protein
MFNHENQGWLNHPPKEVTTITNTELKALLSRESDELRGKFSRLEEKIEEKDNRIAELERNNIQFEERLSELELYKSRFIEESRWHQEAPSYEFHHPWADQVQRGASQGPSRSTHPYRTQSRNRARPYPPGQSFHYPGGHMDYTPRGHFHWNDYYHE